MAVYTEKKTYHTKANMGMIDVTEDFQHAVTEACRQKNISGSTAMSAPFWVASRILSQAVRRFCLLSAVTIIWISAARMGVPPHFSWM